MSLTIWKSLVADILVQFFKSISIFLILFPCFKYVWFSIVENSTIFSLISNIFKKTFLFILIHVMLYSVFLFCCLYSILLLYLYNLLTIDSITSFVRLLLSWIRLRLSCLRLLLSCLWLLMSRGRSPLWWFVFLPVRRLHGAPSQRVSGLQKQKKGRREVVLRTLHAHAMRGWGGARWGYP